MILNINRANNLSERLYTVLISHGKGKSAILLKYALDIKKYNQGIQTKDPDKRPAVLFLTLENGVKEILERIHNIASDDSKLEITDTNNIDIIIKHYSKKEIDINDVYNIIDDLCDDGVEVIALIIDYMKRISPLNLMTKEIIELKNIGDFYNIPVITSQQSEATDIHRYDRTRKEVV